MCSGIRNFSKRNICIITPTKALLNQTRQRILRARIDGVSKIIVHPDMYNEQDDSCVAVLTQERLLALLKDHESLYFDCIVVDEAHNLLAADDRNKLLASAIVMLNTRNKETVFKFLTPFLTNENNLKIRYSHYELLSFAVAEYIKTEKISARKSARMPRTAVLSSAETPCLKRCAQAEKLTVFL